MKLLLLLSLFTIGVLQICVSGVQTKGVLDDTIGKLMEDIKPLLENLTLPNINGTVEQEGIYIHLDTLNITTKGLETFIELAVNTTLIPLRLTNMTLYWEEFSLDGEYALEGTIEGITQGPIELSGEGNINGVLRGLTLTAAADFALKEGHLQITNLYDLDVHLASSVVFLENLLGGGELGDLFDVYFSFLLPNIVNDQGKSILETLSPTIKDLLNDILADIL